MSAREFLADCGDTSAVCLESDGAALRAAHARRNEVSPRGTSRSNKISRRPPDGTTPQTIGGVPSSTIDNELRVAAIKAAQAGASAQQGGTGGTGGCEGECASSAEFDKGHSSTPAASGWLGDGATAASAGSPDGAPQAAAPHEEWPARPRTPKRRSSKRPGTPCAPGHPLRGVSVDYLSSEVGLLGDIMAAGLTPAATVYDIEAPVIIKKSKHVLCPRDNRPGAAYVDCLSGLNTGHSTIMLSYTWGYSVEDIVNVLKRFCDSTSKDRVRCFVWMCCFCVNQHRVKEAQAEGAVVPFDEFRNTFSERVREIGHIVALMTPWHQPSYLKRVWCCFEMFTAINAGCSVTIEMPSRECHELADVLRQHNADIDKCTRSIEVRSSLRGVFKSIASVDIREGKASVAEDRRNILRIIDESGGAATVNQTVSDKLKSWFEENLHITAVEHLPSLEPRQITDLCRPVSEFLRETGQYTKALDVCVEALQLLPPESAETADVFWKMAGVHMKANNVNAALGWLQRSIDMHLRIDDEYRTTLKYARMLNELGALKRKKSDLVGALSVFREAKAVFDATSPELDVRIYTLILGNIGYALFLQGYLDESESYYLDALAARERADMHEHDPETALILNSLGEVQMKQGDIDSATQNFEEAWRIRDLTRTHETVPGQMLKANLDYARSQADQVSSGPGTPNTQLSCCGLPQGGGMFGWCGV